MKFSPGGARAVGSPIDCDTGPFTQTFPSEIGQNLRSRSDELALADHQLSTVDVNLKAASTELFILLLGQVLQAMAESGK